MEITFKDGAKLDSEEAQALNKMTWKAGEIGIYWDDEKKKITIISKAKRKDEPTLLERDFQ